MEEEIQGSSAGLIALVIARECGLQDRLVRSVCLSCKHRVMAQKEADNGAVLYCSELYRDLDVSISRCTSYSPD